ncbi:MAG TPA: hypothetical protein VN704_09175 [Verrucomicrobiae bacterium]|nr:hypothetical protein [Verrucomicrobiae bacterium]
MKGKCEDCGMDNVEVMPVKLKNSEKQRNLCNQCRSPDGAYAY